MSGTTTSKVFTSTNDAPAKVIEEILAGDGLTSAEARKMIPAFRGAKQIAGTTFTRFIREGVLRPDGTVVKLEAVRWGNRWITSRQSIVRLLLALTPPTTSTPPPTTIASTAVNPKRLKAANAKAEKAGF